MGVGAAAALAPGGASDLSPRTDPDGVHAGVEASTVGSEVRSRAALVPKSCTGGGGSVWLARALPAPPFALTLPSRVSCRRTDIELDQVVLVCGVRLMVRRAPVPEAPSAEWDLLPRYSPPARTEAGALQLILQVCTPADAR